MLEQSGGRTCQVSFQEEKTIARILTNISTITTGQTCYCHFSRAEQVIPYRVQELCESRGGRPGLSVLTSLMVSVDVKQH